MSKTIVAGVVRKSILIVLLLIAPHSFALAPNVQVGNPVDAFLKTQNDRTDPVLNAQIAELLKDGYKERGHTGAAFLIGGCGVVGCNSSYFVTTAYSTPGVNPRSRTVAAIVTSHSGKAFQVTRILTKAGLECLANPK